MDAETLERLRRNSGLRLDREGTFHFQDAPVPNPRVQRLFHEGLAVRDDGEVVLHVGEMWAYVGCDGVARFVDGVRFFRDRLALRLRDGREVEADARHLAIGPDERFYVWATVDGPPAVLSRPAHQQVAGRLTADDDGRLLLELASGLVAIRALAAAPGPSTAWSEGP